MGAFGRGASDGAEAFNTVDPDYLSSRGCAAASALNEAEETSPFQRDLRSYGLLTARLTIALVLLVLTTHVLFGRPVLQSLLFAVALAVGLTPELLPMITTVTLSRGAMRMAKRKVIVKRLTSIQRA